MGNVGKVSPCRPVADWRVEAAVLGAVYLQSVMCDEIHIECVGYVWLFNIRSNLGDPIHPDYTHLIDDKSLYDDRGPDKVRERICGTVK
jgi:hypothetical protein